MKWFLAMFIGSIALSILWFFERTRSFSFSTYAKVILPLVLTIELLYWYGFYHAPNFITARYIMSAITHTCGWILAILILSEPVKVSQIFGAILIIFGSFMIAK